MRRIDHYPYPVEPLDRHLTKTPQLTDKKYNLILENLNNQMNIKRVSSVDHFKMFDKDKDGLIKQEDF
jgi:Ca2+-binding EF-hand superfamily protein